MRRHRETVDAAAEIRRGFEQRAVSRRHLGFLHAGASIEWKIGRLTHRRPESPRLLGMRDPGFPRVDLERFEKAFPNHKTIELAGAGHFIFEDAAQEMVREIGAFAALASGSATRSN